jgi:hypothetical protein
MSVLREIAQKVKELLDDLETLEKEEKTTDFEYPFKIGDTCFFINVVGEPVERKWSNHVYEENAYKQGHIFKTKQEVYKERDKRDLLMRFKQFRDNCNGDWKPTINEKKYYIFFNFEEQKFKIDWFCQIGIFELLGTFKNEADAERAVELFGDEIIRLWVDE